MLGVGFDKGELMRFEFATATRIVFGVGTIGETGHLASRMGNRALVVVGGSEERGSSLFDSLKDGGFNFRTFSVPKEPTINLVQEGVTAAQKAGCDLVIGCGGGSVIDAGKAIAALLTNPGEVLDYLEVIGSGQPLVNPPIPYMAIPTTAGTGAEVTRNAVLASPEHRVKVSLRSASMLPDIAIIDPSLTYSLPPAVTASTGMDALSQCIEPYVSSLSNPLTDTICREGMHRAGRSLRAAFEHGDDARAREDMSLTSLCGGLALANAKLGAVHGFAGPLGGMYPHAPHGAICGLLLPFVIEANASALRTREPLNPSMDRFDEVAKILTGDPTATAAEGVNWMRDLYEVLDIPRLSTYGIQEVDFPEIVEKASRASSMKGNPIVLTRNELSRILEKAL
jgi:alcohol dehydrogenase class IV